MELSETVDLMNSEDYKDRFKAEYLQLAIRYYKLKGMLKKWDLGTLGFNPTCPRSTYNAQLEAMTKYLAILEARAVMEDVDFKNYPLLLDKLCSENPDVFKGMNETQKEDFLKLSNSFQTIMDVIWGKKANE